jgi:hypothetical protein
MGAPARHRERSGEAGGPPGNRRVLVPRRTVNWRLELGEMLAILKNRCRFIQHRKPGPQGQVSSHRA